MRGPGLKRYRIYTLKHGEIAAEVEFKAPDDQQALARLATFRRASDHELWDLTSEPIRPVEVPCSVTAT